MAVVLRGITWGHSRGITPLLAAAQRFEELHGVRVEWKKRTLQEFADYPIETLTRDYDLLIIDHPWVGTAAATRCVLPLNEYLPSSFLGNQAENSTGDSHTSYQYGGSQWALAIDAATPAASYRKDLLEINNQPLPRTWEELIGLAGKGKVAVPGIPIDLLMNFYSFCIACGQEPFRSEEEVTDINTGMAAISRMQELWSLVDEKMFTANPIAVAEMMSRTDEYWYCPFAYGYSNYARTGFADHLLHYTDTVTIKGQPLRTTIGGTGLAVSAFSRHTCEALDFAQWITSEEIQQTFYVQHGGQPGHGKAWLHEEANRLTHDYFRQVLPLMQRGYTRPRYHGYLHFQDQAGLPLQQCLMGEITATKALEEMNHIYRQSLVQENPLIQA